MKKLFGLLTFILIGLINFGYCGFISPNGQLGYYGNGYQIPPHDSVQMSSSFGDFFCIGIVGSNGCTDMTLSYGNESITGNPTIGIMCIDKLPEGNKPIVINNSSNSYCSFLLFRGYKNDIFPNYTSLECQQEYDLIPSSDLSEENCRIQFGLIPYDELDTICVNGGFCPSGGDCPGSGDNWSALYVNNIQHLGKPIINITIPDYITWDYTTTESEFNLYCGSGYDQDYIDSIISINSYRPDSGDFTNIFVSGLTLVFPYIVIVLFIVFVRRLLKRIFR